MISIQNILSGGKPNSLGRTEEVVSMVLDDRSKLDELYNCMFVDDELVRLRAGDAVEKICRVHPEWLDSYKSDLFTRVAKIKQASIQWHLVQMLTELHLTSEEVQTGLKLLKSNLKEGQDWIVLNNTLEALAEFTRRGHINQNELIKILVSYQENKYNSVKARAKKLLKEFA